jgi:tetratricopeptide (TPR) repeat protein
MGIKSFEMVGVALLLVFLVSCSSLNKRADGYLEAGQYEKAAATYEQILKRKPGDQEAIAGLRSARQGIISDKLIQVRTYRQADQPNQALEGLLEIMELQKKWDVSLDSGAGYTQQEETQYAIQTAEGHVRTALRQKHALRGESILETVSLLFQGNDQARKDRLTTEIVQAGKNRCQEFLELEHQSRPFFSEFIAHYCAHWKEDSKGILRSGITQESFLIRNVQIQSKIEGQPESFVPFLQREFISALRSTAWYHPQGGQRADVELRGKYEQSLHRFQVSELHSYEEDQFYVEEEQVRKVRKIPVEKTRRVFDSQLDEYREVAYIDHVEEVYYEKQPVKKTRSVPKTFPYGAWRVLQKIQAQIDGVARFGSHSISFQVEGKVSEEDSEHPHDMPQIGLKPKVAEITPPTQWLQEKGQLLASQFETELKTLWNELYCRAGDMGSFEESGDRIMQCFRQQQDHPPAFARAWYERHFGLAGNEVNRRIGYGAVGVEL